jgi:hypothetical protein
MALNIKDPETWRQSPSFPRRRSLAADPKRPAGKAAQPQGSRGNPGIRPYRRLIVDRSALTAVFLYQPEHEWLIEQLSGSSAVCCRYSYAGRDRDRAHGEVGSPGAHPPRPAGGRGSADRHPLCGAACPTRDRCLPALWERKAPSPAEFRGLSHLCHRETGRGTPPMPGRRICQADLQVVRKGR